MELADGLTAESVANVANAYAKRAGFDPADFVGRGLRAGFLTSDAERGASIFKMMEASWHKSADVLRDMCGGRRFSKSTLKRGLFDWHLNPRSCHSQVGL